jgi:hypothetical protein
MDAGQMLQMQVDPKKPSTPVFTGLLQRAAINPSPVYEVPPIVHEVLHSPAHQLDRNTRAFVEPRFGHDFSGACVHINAKAAEAAAAVHARAFTVGHHIVFAPEEYSPETIDGKRLLTHEITHVVQQANGIQGKLTISRSGDEYEQEADRKARAINRESDFMLTERTGISFMRQQENPPAAKEDENVTELKDKVSKLVRKKFGGDYKKAFDSYDVDKDG